MVGDAKKEIVVYLLKKRLGMGISGNLRPLQAGHEDCFAVRNSGR